MKVKVYPGRLGNHFGSALKDFANENILKRILAKDYRVWSEKPDEISNRLGWLDSVETTLESIDSILSFAEEIKDKFKNILLLGMGGSSLAPEVFSKIFERKFGYPILLVLDSTDPDTIKYYSQTLKSSETLYVVSTKSGGTVETISFMKYFFTKCVNEIGDYAGRHFVAITDPGSGLEKMARELRFRKIFLNDANIGGRYSALSLFGIVPAALMGIDVRKLLIEANKIVLEHKDFHNRVTEFASVKIGCLLGEAAINNINKLTLVNSGNQKYLGAWVEQLVAESTGKVGKGILPVDLEPLSNIENYSKDRIFVLTSFENESSTYSLKKELIDKNFPVIDISVDGNYSLGAQFFLWEMITAIAGWRMKIQPFDQPDVESAKSETRKFLSAYQETGKLSMTDTIRIDENTEIVSSVGECKSFDCVKKLVESGIEKQSNSYFAIQAFVDPIKYDQALFDPLRSKILSEYKIATTFGYGPRFLHSTGQLHKGDGGNGLFLQIISLNEENVAIPDDAGRNESKLTFNVLKVAQALGDRESLLSKKRNVVSIFTKDVKDTLDKLESVL
ncbi:MAG: hypothetical protein J5I57_09290 [Melioribacteraceae bacterium]|nr:hypothetical protein [Melioribacteraceae bacterium]